MKRLFSIIAATSLALGGFAMVGCDSNNQARQGHDASFSGGSGEFGTSPAVAGDYPNDVHHANAPATQPSQPGQ